MRRTIGFLCASLLLVGAFALPGSVAASAAFRHTILVDDCRGQYGWTNYFKVRETVSGLTTANRLTIDSKAQVKYFGGGTSPWETTQTWPRVSYSFVADGTDHSLTKQRSYQGGGIEQISRIVFKLRAWHNGHVLWSETVRSMTC
jgi:hypothetical protein